MANQYLALADDSDSAIIYREKRRIIGVDLPLDVSQNIILENCPFELFDGAYIAMKTTDVNVANIVVNILRTVFTKPALIADDVLQFIPIPGATLNIPITAGIGYIDFQISDFYADRIMIQIVSPGANTGVLNDIYVVGKKRN